MESLQHGPIAVGVDASPLQHYRPGGSPTRSRTAYVVSADATKCGTMCGRDETCLEECSIVAGKALTAQQTPTVDHAVVVVGYGTDELGGARHYRGFMRRGYTVARRERLQNGREWRCDRC